MEIPEKIAEAKSDDDRHIQLASAKRPGDPSGENGDLVGSAPDRGPDEGVEWHWQKEHDDGQPVWIPRLDDQDRKARGHQIEYGPTQEHVTRQEHFDRNAIPAPFSEIPQ